MTAKLLIMRPPTSPNRRKKKATSGRDKKTKKIIETLEADLKRLDVRREKIIETLEILKRE